MLQASEVGILHVVASVGLKALWVILCEPGLVSCFTEHAILIRNMGYLGNLWILPNVSLNLFDTIKCPHCKKNVL